MTYFNGMWTVSMREVRSGRRLRAWKLFVAECLHYFNHKTLQNSVISVIGALLLPALVVMYV